MATLTDIFRLSVNPYIGILTFWSQSAKASFDMPRNSLPKTKAIFSSTFMSSMEMHVRSRVGYNYFIATILQLSENGLGIVFFLTAMMYDINPFVGAF